jgi:hypothetical protein
MNNRSLSELGLGLLGVWALLQALVGFMNIAASIVIFPNPEALRSVLLAEAAPVALLLAVGYVLVFHNAAVATAIFPDFGSKRDHNPDLTRVLTGIVGVLLLGVAIPGLIRAVFTLVALREFQSSSSRALQVREFVGFGAQAAFALFLIVRPERLLAILQREEPAHDS